MSRENQTQYGKSDIKKNIETYGKQLRKAMSEDERESLGSKWSTLHFKTLLGLESIQVTRNNGGTGMKPVGVILQSDIDIDDVPDIDVKLDKDTGIDIEKDIKYRKANAGEEFALSYYEFMFLVLRDEYAAFVSYNGYKAVCLSTKTAEFLEYMNEDGSFKVREGDNNPKGYYRIKLPTPTITFVKVKGKRGKVINFGSIRDNNIIAIDEQVADKWRISEEFKDDGYITRFLELIPEDKRAK
ncbi:hypothetical protein [Cohnella sp. AR92]|uniref:hypothetical protein n=1 Tax=Cohnella sp. AR92 TaxID=648716 RepID=UPI000F8EB46E|nr:hypothetical protein [Cohnella sp. AR92]RUS44555.1 hypothetical protein ELR57_22495 [Cohnella sp. AR92]